MTPGIYDNISIEAYHENRFIVSSTGLKEAKKSSRHFAYYLDRGSESKPCFDFGNAFELALIDKINGTSQFLQAVTIYDPEMRPEQGKGITSAANQDWKKALHNTGRYVINKTGAESLETINQMVESTVHDTIITQLLDGTDYQKTFVWKDEETGILCKSRPDISKQRKNVLLDVKTTRDASPQGFAKEAANHDYPLQAIMQIDGVLKSGFLDVVDDYFWLAVEKTAPYNAVLVRFPEDEIRYFYDTYRYYLKRCANTIELLRESKGDFRSIPGYTENADNRFGIIDLNVPLWYKQ